MLETNKEGREMGCRVGEGVWRCPFKLGGQGKVPEKGIFQQRLEGGEEVSLEKIREMREHKGSVCARVYVPDVLETQQRGQCGWNSLSSGR